MPVSYVYLYVHAGKHTCGGQKVALGGLLYHPFPIFEVRTLKN